MDDDWRERFLREAFESALRHSRPRLTLAVAVRGLAWVLAMVLLASLLGLLIVRLAFLAMGWPWKHTVVCWVVCCAVGLIGGFGSVSKGWVFQGGLERISLGSCFVGEVALSIAVGVVDGWVYGLVLFGLAWLVMARIGVWICRAIP